MAKAKKVKKPEVEKCAHTEVKEDCCANCGKVMITIFDLISFLTDKKKKWDELSPAARKMYSPFMVNRFLSMDLYLVDAINQIQTITLSSMDKGDIWNLYYHLLPKQKFYLKYVKPANEVPEKDILALKKYFGVSKRECEDYWLILNKSSKGLQRLTEIKNNYIYED